MGIIRCDKDELGTRMKKFYESIPDHKLTRRTPVIIRIDGKTFHSFLKGFDKPFDDLFIKTMQETTQYLCENIQGCKLGYCESDEMSLLITDYDTFETSAFFDYRIEKICSTTASMATKAFNKLFMKNMYEEYSDDITSTEFMRLILDFKNASKGIDDSLMKARFRALSIQAEFDSRCFNIPKEEVTNYFFWRQLDASRNSVLMVGQANFSYKELVSRSCNEIIEMLMTKNINWADYPKYKQHGTCVIKKTSNINGVERRYWDIDKDIPVFKGEGRDYIERLI